MLFWLNTKEGREVSAMLKSQQGCLELAALVDTVYSAVVPQSSLFSIDDDTDISAAAQAASAASAHTTSGYTAEQRQAASILACRPVDPEKGTDNDEDLAQLLLGHQMHDCTFTCFKKCRPGEPRVCRFKYEAGKGRHLMEQAALEVELDRSHDSVKHFRVLERRNHAWVNPFNRLILLAWRGNTDISFCANPWGVAHYVTSYSSKAEEPDYELVTEKMVAKLRALDTRDSNFFVSALQRAGNTVVGQRYVSVVEMLQVCLGYEMAHFNRNVVDIDVSMPRDRALMLDVPSKADDDMIAGPAPSKEGSDEGTGSDVEGEAESDEPFDCSAQVSGLCYPNESSLYCVLRRCHAGTGWCARAHAECRLASHI
jgi:hypothetical protein